MNGMKKLRFLIPAFLLGAITLTGQNDTICNLIFKNVPAGYSALRQEADLKQALYSGKRDSIYTFRTKVRLLNTVYHFDPFSDPGRRAKLILDSLLQIEKQQFYHDFLGTWTWIWSGSNWGVGDSPKMCHCQKTLVIDSTTMTYFTDGRPTRTVNYTLQLRYADIGRPRQVIKTDNSVCWGVEVADRPQFRDADPSPDATRFLDVTEQYMCGCGCPDSIYER